MMTQNNQTNNQPNNQSNNQPNNEQINYSNDQPNNQSPNPNNKQDSRKTYTQQVFHKSFFESRPRSASISEPSSSASTTHHDAQMEPETKSQKQPPTWQRVPISKKRKICQDPPSPEGTLLENRFEGLPIEQGGDPPAKAPSKPPNIVLYGIEDLNELTKLLETVVKSEDFKYKIVNKNLLRITVNTIENYKKIIDLLRARGLIGHTFARKDTKCSRFVIKNLHHTTPHEAIIEAIEKTGNRVKGEIINARYGADKIPTSTFFVNVEPGINNKEVKKIQYIYHQRIKVEDPRKSTTIVQCQRCQQYGHSKNYCMRPYRCVKCAGGHKSSECSKKDRKTPAKCALCLRDHPANHKGCQVYKEILERKRNKSRFSKPTPGVATDEIRPGIDHANVNAIRLQSPPASKKNSPTIYSSNAKRSHDVPPTEHLRNEAEMHYQQPTMVEQLLIKQSEKFDILLQQISSLMGLLTTLISNIVPK